MKFFNIQNTEEFLRRVQSCSGEVHSIEADGREKDLKRAAEYLIHSGMAARMKDIDEINLIIEKPADMAILMNYAMGMRREKICA